MHKKNAPAVFSLLMLALFVMFPDGLNAADGVDKCVPERDSGGIFHVTYAGGRFITLGVLADSGVGLSSVYVRGADGTYVSPSVSVDDAAGSAPKERRWRLAAAVNNDGIYAGAGLIECRECSFAALFNSTDGIKWTPVDVKDAGDTSELSGVAWGGGVFVAVGADGSQGKFFKEKGELVFNRTLVMISKNGKDWERGGLAASGELNSVVFGKGKFAVAGSGGKVYTSLDGRKWYAQKTGVTEDIAWLTLGMEKFVAVGGAGVIITSLDARRWVKQDSGTKESITGVAFGNGVFVAVTAEGGVLVSENGRKWARHDVEAGVYQVTFGGGRFVGVGCNASNYSEPGAQPGVESGAKTGTQPGTQTSSERNPEHTEIRRGVLYQTTDGAVWERVNEGAGDF